MKTLVLFFVAALISYPVFAQGVQDGEQGSGGDEQAEYSIAVNPQWNMVAVPVGVSDFLKTALFPGATSNAIAYEGGMFVTKDTLDNGPGYWLKFGSGVSIPMSGDLIYTDSIPVNAGWNLVGSISDPIPSSSVTAVGTSVQSSFFSFSNGYLLASSIEPGLAHWVKTSTSGTLVMSSGSYPRRHSQDSLEIVLAALNTLRITDANGEHQTLYFGNADARIRSMAELPPVPPSGIFDARFASHSMIASGNENILLSSAEYPLELEWTITAPGNHGLVVEGRTTSLSTSGVLRLSEPVRTLSLRVGTTAEIPEEFGLSQNYPNPFNPSTVINYQLPVDSRVTLKVFNLLGQEVTTLVEDIQPAGYKRVEWNARRVAAGTYFLRINAGSFTAVRKMMLLK